MKGVEYLAGTEDVTRAPLPAFSDEAVEFLSALSRKLMGLKELRVYPDISAFAFWCRRGNLMRLRRECPEAENRLGRGLCFHIAPGNIPVNFAFSYAFGLLSGCSNIVRLSSREYPEIFPLCRAVSETLKSYPEIKKRTAFVRYEADDEITASFCAGSDARMIWGGDETIRRIKAMPAAPRCVDICFADRYSVCVIDGNAVLSADDALVRRLSDGFYNDTYLMDQNACSSEQLIFWLNDSKEARDRFWKAVLETAGKRYELQSAVSADKYAQSFEDVLNGVPIGRIIRDTGYLFRAELAELRGDLSRLRGRGGYFYEYGPGSLEETAPFITDRFQTVTYFGVSPEEIREFVISNRLRGIDRIVPIGKAMDIDIMWDGFDLVRMLSRRVDAI